MVNDPKNAADRILVVQKNVNAAVDNQRL